MKKLMCAVVLLAFVCLQVTGEDERRDRGHRGNISVRTRRSGVRNSPEEMRASRDFEKEFRKAALKFGRNSQPPNPRNIRFSPPPSAASCCPACCHHFGGGRSYGADWRHHEREHPPKLVVCLFFLGFVLLIHILLTIWVYKDTRERNSSGIWIVITLLTGFMGAFLYALVRIGDLKK